MAPKVDCLNSVSVPEEDGIIRCALLGCGMMGQEHISYIMGYSHEVRIDFLCDPFQPSLEKAHKIMKEYRRGPLHKDPTMFTDEDDLLSRANEIDLLVVASPNYMHTPTLLKWGKNDIAILCEKPVAVSPEQHNMLLEESRKSHWRARVWVAMEYRYIPAIAKLLSVLPEVGELKMVTIRENRYPFLHKVGDWNRDRTKTGDSLVEKCCHFFDLFRLITGQEAALSRIRALAQRGVNYQDEPDSFDTPIIDSAYVTMPFVKGEGAGDNMRKWSNTIGCLELCMFAEGSRHQEEVVVTGTKGRLEAFLPENKVYLYVRPSHDLWKDRTIPPPESSVRHHVFDCTDVKSIHGIQNEIPTHGGYHYCSTAIEWYHLLREVHSHRQTGEFHPQVSLHDGLRAVEIGMQATTALVNDANEQLI